MAGVPRGGEPPRVAGEAKRVGGHSRADRRPRAGQGIVERKVVRIVTPGTVTTKPLLRDRRDNPLLAIAGASRATPGLGRPRQRRFRSMRWLLRRAWPPSWRARPGRDPRSPRTALCRASSPNLPGSCRRAPRHFDHDTALSSSRASSARAIFRLRLRGPGAGGAAAGALLGYARRRAPLSTWTGMAVESLRRHHRPDAARAQPELDSTQRPHRTRPAGVPTAAPRLGARALDVGCTVPLRERTVLRRRHQALATRSTMPLWFCARSCEAGDLERILARVALLARPRDPTTLRDGSAPPRPQQRAGRCDSPAGRTARPSRRPPDTAAHLARAVVEQPPLGAVLRDGGVVPASTLNWTRAAHVVRPTLTSLVDLRRARKAAPPAVSPRLARLNRSGYYIEVSHANADRCRRTTAAADDQGAELCHRGTQGFRRQVAVGARASLMPSALP